MIKIPLTQGKVALIDDEDAHLAQHRWCLTSRRYATRRAGSSMVLLHRAVLGAPPGAQVSFLDGDALDCRRSNLRLATRHEVKWLRRKPRSNTSGYLGPWRRPDGRFAAEIETDGRRYFLGNFNTAEEAARARDAAALRLRDAPTRLNFPQEKTA